MFKDDSLKKDAKILSPQLRYVVPLARFRRSYDTYLYTSFKLINLLCSSNPFAEAILSFIDELRDNEDRKSIFYKEVIQVACRLYLTDDPARPSQLSAETLSTYITDLEVQHRKKNGIRRALSSAQPLVEGLLQYTSAVDVMIQADPTVSALLYGGAKLILQVRLSDSWCTLI